MRYEGKLFRPPSEADSYLLQATIGCSHNLCTYCDMYRDKKFRVRALDESLEDLKAAGQRFGQRVEKLFVADGDALTLPMSHWLPILETARQVFPRLRRASCYAMARNVLAKTDQELQALRDHGLSIFYMGPESGDPITLKRIVKGDTFDEHVEAATRAHAANIGLSVITLLGAGGVARSQEHAEHTAQLITQMNPEFFSALTLTVIPGTPLAKMQDKGGFVLPDIFGLLREMRTLVSQANPTNAVFRTNHASNYLPIAGNLPTDRAEILSVIDAALDGKIPLKPERLRGL
jgi:radical SAM superfamily enzyme YgiQ (UPF0313 family)